MIRRRTEQGEPEVLVCPKCDKAIEPTERWYGRGWCDTEIVTFVWRPAPPLL